MGQAEGGNNPVLRDFLKVTAVSHVAAFFSFLYGEQSGCKR